MSNIFQEVLTDVNGLENKLLGPSYPYWQNIKSPSQIGMSSEGSLSAMGRDIDGLIQYVEVLVTGGGNASTTGGPLGNKFFLQSGGKCLDVKNCKDPNDTSTCPSVDRFIYINNVPQGNIPFISSAMGENFSEFKGLIPGTISNLNAINPFAMMQSFMAGSTPPCQEVTLETINVNNVKSTETHFVTVVDLQNMDPCNFQNGKNPITGQPCRQAFTNPTNNDKNESNNNNDNNKKNKHTKTVETMSTLPNDGFVQFYFAGLGVLAIYIMYCLVHRKMRK
jgi:hypothetical protein